jgi:hypothetical protein
MEERWARLSDYPTYAVSTRGQISNIKRDTLVRPKLNQQGIPNVSLYEDGHRFTKAVGLLVAQTFIPRVYDYFNSPLNLDGVKTNCEVDNLLWRPRGYVRKYLSQVAEPYFHEAAIPTRELSSGEEYETYKQASIANGLRYTDIQASCITRAPSRITFQRFELIE